MATYRQLLDKLLALSQEQLDSEIKVIPVGFTDSDAEAIINCNSMADVLELTKASRDVYHFAPAEDGDWCEPGMCDFSGDEIRDMGIDEDNDYTLVCRKGDVIFKIRDNVQLIREEQSNIGNIDTSILHL